MMKRPVMNPSYLDEEKPKAGAGRIAHWRRVARFLGRIAKILLTDVLRRKDKLRVEVGTPFSRFTRGLLYRLMFVPTVLAALVAALVITATHPRPAVGVSDPTSLGVYYDPVELLSLDNTKLEGWLVPVLDAHRVLTDKDKALHRRHPAIVLVHDFGASRQQVLPLVAPLHEAGYVLLAINLRGRGPSSTAGSTFGLNEAQDVRAAVELLRRRPFVDPDAIGVLGIGTGATAALIAAEQDSRINTLILDHPVRQFQDVLDDRIGPRQAWLSWVRPLCKWTFEIAYKVDAEEMELVRFGDMMKRKHVLMLDEPGETVSCFKPVRGRQTVEFLKKHLVARNTAVTILPKTTGAVTEVKIIEEPPAADAKSSSNESWPPQRPANQLLERTRATGW
jgi:pimeloyl-ACP methyl ester carboxylesterase